MDLDTFLTILYVQVDTWYKQHLADKIVKHAGATARLTDSEVLTIALAGQWRGNGLPWQSERGVVRFMQRAGRAWFPNMLGRSQFNVRVRWLWGAFVELQQVVAAELRAVTDGYECVDCEPLPAYSNGQALKENGHGLWQSMRGHGGTSGGWYTGDKLLLAVTPQGVATGWVVGAANIQDRWLLEALLSQRAGCPQLTGPAPSPHASRAERACPPLGFIGSWPTAGSQPSVPYLADRGFNSRRWRQHWQAYYHATVLSVPPRNDPDHADWSKADCHWLASHRQPVETAFSVLDTVFELKHINAHSRWGQLTRTAAKLAAYNIGLFINRALNRPLHAFATLIV